MVKCAFMGKKIFIAAMAAVVAFSPWGELWAAGGAEPGPRKAPLGAAGLKKGCLLVATGNITAPPFSRSVILLTNYGPQGALGVILNRPLSVSLADALPAVKGLPRSSDRLFYGGPVSRNVLTLLMESGEDLEKSDGAVRVFGDVFFVANKEIINRALKDPAKAARSFSGYAGWAAGQLENELSRGDWSVESADSKSIFSGDPEKMWGKFREPSGEGDWTQNKLPGGFPFIIG